MKSILEIAREYIKKGWSPIPIPLMSKNPVLEGWQNLRLTEETIADYFGNESNVGVLLGEPSGGLTDVDLDCPESILLSPKFIPSTGTFGREHAPKSHHLFITSIFDIEPYQIMINGKLEKLLEIRGKGQTVFPGSLYKGDEEGRYRGERIWWDDPIEVVSIDANDLRRKVGMLAAASYLLRIWNRGVRDEITITLVGTMIRREWDPAAVDDFIGTVAIAASDEQASLRYKADKVKSKLESEKGRVPGIPKLKRILGSDTVDILLRWLGLTDEESGFFKGRTFVPTRLRDYVAERYEFFHDGISFNLYLQQNGYYKEVHDNVPKGIMSDLLKERATTHYIHDALNLLEYKVFNDLKEVQYDHYLVNLRNGMLDIRTKQILPHDKKYFSRAQVPIAYDPKAECPEWMKFLESAFADDPGKISAIQDFAGYCMCPDSFIHKGLFNWGGGGNGKNTLTDTLTKMLGHHNCCSLRWSNFSQNFVVTELRNKFLNVSSEIDTDSKLSTEMFKMIVSGDRIDGQVKYQQKLVSFKPFVKLIFNVNELPVITDRTDAFKRRVLVIRFNQKFDGENEIKSLGVRFEPELSGILNWALKGLERVLETKEIYESPTMKIERERFLKIMNPMLYFLEEMTVFEEGGKVGHAEFYEAYVTWCQKNGQRAKGKIKLFEDFRSEFPWIKDDTYGPNKFMGIRLKEEVLF